MIKIIFLLYLRIEMVYCRDDQWVEPYFLNTSHNAILQDYYLYQRISLDEEQVVPFDLAEINYKGDEIPFVASFSVGDNNFLGATIFKNEKSKWIIQITKRQDYENEHQRIYIFSVNVKSVAEHLIRISIKNIFDNNPSLTYFPSPCKIEEEQSNFLTDCIFDVYDADGMSQNEIKIKVDGLHVGDDMFALEQHGDQTEYSKRYALKVLRKLHYEERVAYNLFVYAYDLNHNQGNITAVIEVVDIPNKDPIWVKPLTTETFPEKSSQVFSLKAIDGDTGINKAISYRLEFQENDYSSLMFIGRETGELNVYPIDRDLMDQNIFSFTVCAYKFDNESWVIKNIAVFIVQDIDDHLPEINIKPSKTEFLENTYLTLDLKEFTVNDLDFGVNATYHVSIQKFNTNKCVQALDLVPTSGYKLEKFHITVKEAYILDYEDEECRNFIIEIMTEEAANKFHKEIMDLEVRLINWNDEKPFFEKDAYIVDVEENIESGVNISQVMAKDFDIGDEVRHFILGNVPGIYIREDSGIVSLMDGNIFNYEKQKTIILQIMASDTLITDYSNSLHTVYAQLTINVVDVNDETPVLIMPRGITNVTENSFNITSVMLIQARDPDTTAKIKLEIFWEKSYATKGGQEVDRKFFEGCFLLEKADLNRNMVNGFLTINPDFRKKYEIDFEKYDTIFLIIRATDLNQEINLNYIEESLAVRIVDLNDNPPEFAFGTLSEIRKVLERQDIDTIIGSVSAFDIDGLENNKIAYNIRSINVLTGDDLVAIDANTGVLRVVNLIQCDLPKIQNLEYEITISDSFHVIKGNIKIYIIDVNDKSPEIDDFEQQINIYENADAGIIGQIKAHDNDRDGPHNVLRYTIFNVGSSIITNLFHINITSGEIYFYESNGVVLDRDNGIEFYEINIDVSDNFDETTIISGPSNHATTFVNLTILDVNDNAPQLPLKSVYKPQFFEENIKGTVCADRIFAPDNDKPNTPNSRVSYEIVSIKPAFENKENVQNYYHIFGIEDVDNMFGQIVANKDLKGYYGVWEIEIRAFDYGNPVMSNSSVYDLHVRPYNFHTPKILYPYYGTQLRLCILQEPGKPLLEANCLSQLKPFQAYDPDGGIFGEVTFTLSSANGDHELFFLLKENRNQTHLRLKKPVDIRTYTLNIDAHDGDGKFSTQVTNMKVVFVDMQGYPFFQTNEFETNFTENDKGLYEKRFIPEAEDQKNQGIENKKNFYKMFYFIDDTFRPEDANHFIINKESREISLTQTLDREEQERYILKIRVTNQEHGGMEPIKNISCLTLTVMVNDENDEAPLFNETSYAAGITAQDAKGKQILTYFAFDPDINDFITFLVRNDSIRTQGEKIDHLKLDMFQLDEKTGILTLSTSVTDDMKGYFVFDVIGYDSASTPHLSTVTTKIYVIAESNRVNFIFLTDFETVYKNEKIIRQEFQNIYEYETCNIDNIRDIGNSNSNKTYNDAPITEVLAHFIHNNEAVEALEIQKKSDDLRFISVLQNRLQQRNLILNDVPHLKHNQIQHNSENILAVMLLSLSVSILILCVILIFVLIMKIKKLKTRLKAFEPLNFGSTPSNINQIGSPTTNLFSVEGSNSAITNGEYDEDGNFRFEKKMYLRNNIEQSSRCEDEYDFVGIMDNPLFTTKILNEDLMSNLHESLDKEDNGTKS